VTALRGLRWRLAGDLCGRRQLWFGDYQRKNIITRLFGRKLHLQSFRILHKLEGSGMAEQLDLLDFSMHRLAAGHRAYSGWFAPGQFVTAA
jgi:hypothetical protein